MENQIYNKPMYKCGICGEVYDSIPERVKCEQSCLKKQEEEAKKAAEAKKNAEKNVRKKEVQDAIENANKLLTNFVKDYGSYELYCDASKDNDEKYFWPSKLLHDWFF